MAKPIEKVNQFNNYFISDGKNYVLKIQVPNNLKAS